MDAREFQDRIKFYERGGKLYGVVYIQDYEGRLREIRTKEEDAIDINLLTNDLAREHELSVGWGLGDAFSAVKSVAKGAAVNSVTKGLYSAAKEVTGPVYDIAKNPAIQATIASTVPGGAGIVLGIKAVQMVEAVKNGDGSAAARMAEIAQAAADGNPEAAKALEILKSANEVVKDTKKAVATGQKAANLIAAAKGGSVDAKKQIKYVMDWSKVAGNAAAAKAAKILQNVNKLGIKSNDSNFMTVPCSRWLE